MRFLLQIAVFLPFLSLGQNYFQNHFGATGGIVVDFGTTNNRIGLNLKAYYTDYFYQSNVSSTIYFNGKGYGGRKNFWESRNALGLVLLAGKKQMPVDFQLDGLNHQTPFNYGIGYNYVWYFDNANTSQRSGGFVAHIKNVSVYHENDVFGGQAKDRFRTGHIYVTYRKEEFKFAFGINLWTGETAHARWEKIHLDKTPNGFKVLEDLPHGKTSHGIAYGAVVFNLPYGQSLHLRLGVDSEQIRHTFQNRLMHDLPFLPRKIKRSTPHYPRLDVNGCPVFTRENVKPASFFMQFGSNGNWSD